MNYLYLLTFFVTLLVIILIITKKGDSRTVPALPDGVYKSIPFEQLQQYTDKRLEFIKNNSKNYMYYDERIFDFITPALKNAKTLDQYVNTLFTVPNAEVGYYPILPLKGNPDDYMGYQFEQGMIGWYWIYSTFYDPVSKAAATYFVTIGRFDIFPPKLREELDLSLGSTTYYTINAAASVGGKWNYSEKTTLPGVYTKNGTNFSIDLSSSNISLNLTGNSSFCDVSCSFINANQSAESKITSFSCQMNSTRPGFWNGPKGCAPCAGGSGTLYFSKTNYDVSANIDINNASYKLSNGVGWIDRQWQNRRITKPFLNILSNLLSTFSTQASSFTDYTYIWTPINIAPNKQYAPFTLTNEKLHRGKVLKGYVIKYSENDTDLTSKMSPTQFTILDGVEYLNSFWPTKIFIDVDNGYIVDQSPFGLALSPETKNGTFHQNGSTVVYDKNMKFVGTGFLEGNDIQDQDVRIINYLKTINLPSDEKSLDLIKKYTLSAKQTYPSFLIIFVLVILIIMLPVLLYKTFA